MSRSPTSLQDRGSAAVSPPALSRVHAIALAWAVLLLVGYLPLLARFASEQWYRTQYQFFPLMVISAAAFAVLRLREVRTIQPSTGRLSTLLLVLALGLFAAASVLWSGRLAATSLLMTLIAVAGRLGGRPALKALVPSFLLLALVIGPPVGSEEALLQRLRELAVAISSGVLMLLNIPHLTTGTIIEIPGSRLLVAEACSGINSLMAVLGCTMVIGFARRRSPRVLLMLLFSGVLFVLWANILRIAGGVWLKVHYEIDVLSGDAHEHVSIALFAMCILLVLCTDEAAGLLRWLLKQDEMPAPESPMQSPPPAFSPARLGWPVWGLALLFAATGGASAAYAHRHGGLSRWLSEPAAAHLDLGASFTGPAQLGAWTRSEDAEKLIAQPELDGKRSQVWAYQQGGLIALVAVDFPFAGFHDLTLCYRNGGWTIVDEKPRSSATGKLPGHFTAIDLIRLNERGLVWYSALNERGEWAERPAKTSLGRIQQRLERVGRPDWHSATYQVQLFAHAYEPFTDAQRASLEELFLQAREALGLQVLSQLEDQ